MSTPTLTSDDISKINSELRHEGLHHLFLRENPTSDEVTRARRALRVRQIDAQIPREIIGPEREHEIRRRIALETHSANPTSFLGRLFSRASASEEAAKQARAEADRALNEASDLAARIEKAGDELKQAQAELAGAQNLRASFEDELASIQNPEAVAARWIRCVAGDFAGTPRAVQVDVILDQVATLEAVLTGWPDAEKVLLARVDSAQALLTKLQKEVKS